MHSPGRHRSWFPRFPTLWFSSLQLLEILDSRRNSATAPSFADDTIINTWTIHWYQQVLTRPCVSVAYAGQNDMGPLHAEMQQHLAPTARHSRATKYAKH